LPADQRAKIKSRMSVGEFVRPGVPGKPIDFDAPVPAATPEAPVGGDPAAVAGGSSVLGGSDQRPPDYESTAGYLEREGRAKDAGSVSGSLTEVARQEKEAKAKLLLPFMSALALAKRSGDPKKIAEAEAALLSAQDEKPPNASSGSAAGQAVRDLFGGGKAATSAAGQAAADQLDPRKRKVGQ
jgi:hypothetical protein